MATAVGPVFTGGFEEFVTLDENGEKYTILYLPDRNNDLLQADGKPPVYYWVPGTVRLAQFGDTGDYKFRHIHFVGILDEDTHVGVDEHSEVTGGLLSFTTTSRYPTAVLEQAQNQLLDKFRGDDDRYWGWRTEAAPMFRIAPIRSNRTAITNLSPGANGTAPAEEVVTGVEGRKLVPENKSMVRRADLSKQVKNGASRSIQNLDAWAWELQGQGPASVTGGENAFAGLIGSIPSDLVWAGFHGGASPIVVTQNMSLPMWSQEIYLKITGSWERIFTHFSAHANASYKWFSADIKAEFNKLRISGGIKVEMAIDGTIPGAEDMQDEIDKRIEMVYQEFEKQAAKVIFDPPIPSEAPAKAEKPSGGILGSLFGGGGLGLALKVRRDQQNVDLYYEETRYHRYLQPNTISSTFRGLYNEIKDDSENSKKYFTRHILGDMNRKVRRICKPVVNWRDPAKEWIGDPVQFLSAEVGYPDSRGNIDWRAHPFQSTDSDQESQWIAEFVKRNTDEVDNPPSGWTPDTTYIRRRVHLKEPSGANDNEFVKTFVEKNTIDLDPMGGTAMTDSIIEVRADSTGKLEVGPIDIDIALTEPSQVVTVEFQAEGTREDGTVRPIVNFQWKQNNYDQARYWEVYTGQLDFVARYKYRVHVAVKGTLFTAGMAWSGPWEEGIGNGNLMVHVPRPDEPGVVSRRLSPREVINLNDGLSLNNSESTENVNEDIETLEHDFAGEVESDSDSENPTGRPPGMPMPKTISAKGKTVSGYKVSKTNSIAPPPENSTHDHVH